MEYQYPLKFGKYLLTRRIAVGGMAEVFKAKLTGPKGFEKTLAVKKILPEFGEDEDFVQMFVDEARISSSLHHANIVQVFDFGEVNESYYIAMEFIDGPNLKNLLQRCMKNRGRFPRNHSLYISLQIAAALEYAHTVQVEGKDVLNLIHRDVSPQNVLVSRNGEVKITDFGIAKAAIKVSRTQPGKVQGKLSYMSPEQASGQKMDRRSDIFSLGVIMFELLSGVKVYAGDDTGQRYASVRDAKFPRLATLVPDLPSQLESLVMRMLSRDPTDRPASCAEIIRELGEIASDVHLANMPAEIGSVVSELFQQEKSDSSIGRRVLQIIDGGRTEGEPATEVDVGRVKPMAMPRQEGITRSVRLEKTVSNSKAFRTILLLFLLAASFFAWFQYSERPRRLTPVVIQKETTPAPVLPIDVSPQPGPADPDIAEAARRRQEEVESLQEKLKESEARQRATEKELQEKDREIRELEMVAAAPIPPCPKGMVLIKAGSFLFGSALDDRDRNDLVEKEAEIVPIHSFCIDRYEHPNQKGSMPVAGVTWNEALSACTKQGKRLCTQEEWERTCKGPGKESPRYPYGEKWNPRMCNTEKETNSNIAPIGSFRSCRTREGAFDMSGNVEEWTQDRGPNSRTRVTKGGSGLRPGYQARCASIRWVRALATEADVGFRCCKDAN